MGLLTKKSELTSLKYGKDRPGGGSSNQPYMVVPIPDSSNTLSALGNDFILRGGALAVKNSINDVSRLSKYFLDLKSPNGLLFILKQNLLSRTAVKTQSSRGLLNEGVYSPLNTLAEAGIVAFGGHVNKQGINPIPGGFGSIRTYSDIIHPTFGTGINIFDNIYDNRLGQLYLNNISSSSDTSNLYSYQGGPGSYLGIGKTYISFSDQRTGLNNSQLKNSKFFEDGFGVFRGKNNNDWKLNGNSLLGVSDLYFTKFKIKPSNGFNDLGQIDGSTRQVANPFEKDSTLSIVDSIVSNNGNTHVLTQDQINELAQENETGRNSVSNGNNFQPKIIDFRNLLRAKISDSSTIISLSPDYQSDKVIETRTNLGDPGNSIGKNIYNYKEGFNGSGAASETSYDKINTSVIYSSERVKTDGSVNDLVKFRIQVIDNDNPTSGTFLHFRAFLNSINDGFNAEFNSTRYNGRGENFYNYLGFTRQVSLSWTVAAQSKIELIPMYKKLNYLASITTPDYSINGFMRGNLVKLTIGGYFYEQPGIITSLNYSLDEESPWEIGIDDKGNNDSTVKELPHIIKVTGFNFIPIHTFVPRKQQNTFPKDGGDVLSYGKERYIALENGIDKIYSNYDN